MIYATIGAVLIGVTVILAKKYRDPENRAVIAALLSNRLAVATGGALALGLLALDAIDNGLGAGLLGGLGLAVAVGLLAATVVNMLSGRAQPPK